MKIGLDFDDVLSDLIQIAIDIVNKKYPNEIPIHINDVNSWGVTGTRTDLLLEEFKNKEIYLKQNITNESKQFVKDLQLLGEVYITTAIAPQFMGIRAKQILDNFDIDEDHIIMGKAKNLYILDIVIDDAPRNILDSKATYPILFRKPWNQSLSGVLSANNYDQIIHLVKQIQKTKKERKMYPNLSEPYICALVGPSGSKKSEITLKAIEDESYNFMTVHSYTSNPNALSQNHCIISKENFDNMKKNNCFIETTMYGGYDYGIKKCDIENILNCGKNIIIPMDICGAISLKVLYPTVIVFLYNSKEDMIKNILDKKNISKQEKTLRLLSMDNERKNKYVCDYIYDVNNKKLIK